MRSINTVSNAFNKLFQSTTQTVSFNPFWLKGQSIEFAVGSRDYRLILPHGKVVKTTDPQGRRVLFVGTEYGLVALNETYTAVGDPVRPIHYHITRALSVIWESYYRRVCPTSGYAHHDHVPDFCNVEFLQQIATIAQSERVFGREPSDGMPKMITQPGAPARKTHHPSRSTQPVLTSHLLPKKKKVPKPNKRVPIAAVSAELAQE